MKLIHAFAAPLTAVLVTAALALAGLRQEPVESPADELKEADRAFSRETTERGLAGWLAWFAADALILEPGGEPARGVEGVRRYYESVPGFPPSGFRWEPDSAGLATSGELGWTSGTYSTAQVEDAGDLGDAASGREAASVRAHGEGDEGPPAPPEDQVAEKTKPEETK